MIVAFPVDLDNGLNSVVSDSFGMAKYLILVNIEDGEVSRVDVVPVFAQAFGAIPQFLSELDVRVVVCNNIGDKPREMLDLQGIHLFPHMSGRVSSIVSQLMHEFEEIERKDNEEMERREKARIAMEKMRERNASFWGGISDEGFSLIVQLDKGLLVISWISDVGSVYVAEPVSSDENSDGEVSSNSSHKDKVSKDTGNHAKDKISHEENNKNKLVLVSEFCHFYGSRLTKRDSRVLKIVGDTLLFGDNSFCIVWDDVLPDDLRSELENRLSNVCGDEPDKADIKALNDRVRELVEQYSVGLDV